MTSFMKRQVFPGLNFLINKFAVAVLRTIKFSMTALLHKLIFPGAELLNRQICRVRIEEQEIFRGSIVEQTNFARPFLLKLDPPVS
jgi:hypothetical protein